MTAEINLLPWRENLRCKNIFYFKLLLLVFVAAAALILLLWHAKLKQKINSTAKQAHSLQLQQKQIAKQLQAVAQLQQQQQQWQQAANYMKGLGHERVKFVQLFGILHQALPSNLYLEQLLIKQQGVKIMGRTQTLADLKQFIANIAQVRGGVIPTIQKISRQNYGYDFVLFIFI